LSIERVSIFRGTCRFFAVIFVATFFIICISLWTVSSPQSILNSFTSADMIHSVKLSLLTSTITTVIVMLSALLIAYSLSEDSFRGKSIVKTVLDIPIAFPEILIGIMLLIFLGNTPLNYMMDGLGIQIVFTDLGVICAQFFVSLPYTVRICYSTFCNIDRRLKFVSRSLGYTEFETFRNIMIPLSRDGILAATIITFSRCIGCFGAVLIVAGGTYQKTDTLPISLYLNLSYGNVEMAVASGIFLMIISFITIFFLEKMGAYGNEFSGYR